MTVNKLRCGNKSKVIKATPELKQQIYNEFMESNTTVAELARKYNLSWTTVKYIVTPGYYDKMKEYNRNYTRDIDKEHYNEIMQRHRDYKRQLHKEGKI